MKKWNLLVICFLFLLCSCSHLDRSPESGYSSASKKSKHLNTSHSSSLSHQQWQKTLAQLGMSAEELQSPEGQMKFQEALEIKSRELQLTDEREKRQYFQNQPWLKNPQEQLDFLKQNGYYARQMWLRKKGVGKRPLEPDEATEDLIAAKDIALGMPFDYVKKSWGQPDSIDISGNALYGNQRWRYKRYTPSTDGYQLQSRIIYFESGRVAGWEQIDH